MSVTKTPGQMLFEWMAIHKIGTTTTDIPSWRKVKDQVFYEAVAADMLKPFRERIQELEEKLRKIKREAFSRDWYSCKPTKFKKT